MSLRPPGVCRSSGPDAVELALACGIVPDEWQCEELYWALAELPTGSWAATEIDLICSRQNGKNVILEIRELYGLVVLGERILHTAHLFPTAKESYAALEQMVLSNPDIAAELVDHHASPASGYDMRFRSGGLIQYIARSRSSGRGFRGIDLLVMDEAQSLGDEAQGALTPTTSSKPGAQKWYQGSAPSLESTVLHRIRAYGRSGRQGQVSYAEYSADPDSSLDDRAAWAQANPAFPHRISEATILGELREMSPEMFAQERLSISPDPLEAGGPFGQSWMTVCDPDAAADLSKSMFAVDVNLERTAAAIVACGPGQRLSVLESRPGTDWIIPVCKELRAKYKARFVVDKTGPIGSFIDEMKRNRVRIVELDGTEMTRASGHMFDAVKHGSATVRTNDDLDRAVAGATQQAVGDTWRWGRKSSSSDICLLVAATGALWGFSQKRSKATLTNMADLMCPKCGAVKGDCEHETEV